MDLPSKLNVRQATAPDMGAVLALARELADAVADPDPGSDATPIIDALFSETPWGECLVAEYGGEIVGFVLFCRHFEARTGQRSLWIADLAVAAERQKAGIGRALLRAVESRAAILGANAVSFEVWKQNKRALAFYNRLGAEFLDDRYLMLMTGQSPART